jgi:hypothetical protein
MSPYPLFFNRLALFVGCFLGSERPYHKSGHYHQNTVAKAWQLLNSFQDLTPDQDLALWMT